jgi:DNA-binding NarL/FixJ family response regulator
MNSPKLGKVLVVDDDTFIRTSLEGALKSSGFEVTGAVSNVRDALSNFRDAPSEIALIDIDLGLGPTGIDLAFALRKLDEKIGIIFLTSYLDPRFADSRNSVLPKGSRYLVKSEIENLAQVISVVLQTKHKPFNQNINHMNRYQELTDAQIEVWRCVSEGLSSAEIAVQRGVSEKAIEATLARIYHFLDIKRDKTHNPRILLVIAFKKMSGKL